MVLVQQRRQSSSILPTHSSVEAVAMLMGVQQMRKLRYEQVTFISDCKQLIDELTQYLTETTTHEELYHRDLIHDMT